MMLLNLDDSIHIQTGNPATRAVNPGNKTEKDRLKKKEDIVHLFDVFI